MAAIITNKFRFENLKSVMQSFNNDNYYLFIGKPTEWNDEASPDTPADSQVRDTDIWNEAIAAKRINEENIRYGIYLRVWTSGDYYDMYRHDYDGTVAGVDLDGNVTTPDSLYDASYYVIDDVTLNVYKCLYNRSQTTNTVVASTDKPSGTGSGVIVTSDGYRWKYMFTVPSGDAAKFNTPSFIPAPALGESVLVDGGIYSSVVTNGGSGYSSSPTVTITGDGSGATATAVVTSNVVTAITITAAGSGYTNAKITITGGGGSNATAKPMISPNGGHGYAPAEELGGVYLIIQQKLEAEEAGQKFTVANQFRQLGIIKNPVKYISGSMGQVGVEADTNGHPTTKVIGDGTAFTTNVVVGDVIKILNPAEGTENYLVVASITDDEELFTENVPQVGSLDLTPYAGTLIPYDYEIIPSSTTLRLCRQLTFTGALSGSGVFDEDVQITGGTSTAKGLVIDWDNTAKVARYILDYSVSTNIVEFQNSETVSDGGGQSGTVTASGAVRGEVVPYSGQIIYYENRRAVNRSADQTEDCRIVIEF